MDTNEISYPGYGLDEWCEKAGEEIKKYLDTDKAEVHFLLGGTQVNYTVAAAALVLILPISIIMKRVLLKTLVTRFML